MEKIIYIEPYFIMYVCLEKDIYQVILRDIFYFYSYKEDDFRDITEIT